MITGRSPIDMNSLVTRIARYVKVMDGAEVTFLPETEAYRYEVGLEHFVQRHMMREGPETLSLCVTLSMIGRSSCHARDSLSLSLLGEKYNLTDGEKGTCTVECCRTTDEEHDPAQTIVS